jgi:hypothetical protein
VPDRAALHKPPHALLRRIHLAEGAHLAPALAVGACLGDIDVDENLCN